MEFLAGLILGIVIGIVYVQYRIRTAVKIIMDKISDDMINSTPRSEDIRKMKLLRIEIQDSMMYAYDHKTEEFSGQGPNLTELAKSVEPYCKIATADLDGKTVWFIDGVVIDDLSKLDGDLKVKL